MASAARTGIPAARAPEVRHFATVRVTHWLTALCFAALLISGANLVISHPRFYWGESGNVRTPALFELPIPSSRASVQTGFGYVLPDQNGWSRSLHFQAAWILVFAGGVYGLFSLTTRHLQQNLMPARSGLEWRSLLSAGPAGSASYNPLQRLTYLAIVFVAFPLMIWTGLAMSPAVVSALPGTVSVFGGHQSARTIHFAVTIGLVVFLIGHVAMVYRAGFRARTMAMITGRPGKDREP